ncbi:hypothetical protein BD626DRAFT_563596 [Schizophyllum amplum]|uniref:Uncharacterized protein n=1 Tax=Schizophyllum amplum TaxID=97359 RepID=A0A550CYL0_9AGAR|nr:hypothetical protein BD626DRAFT_563596 [Auriculariopsis ampla]
MPIRSTDAIFIGAFLSTLLYGAYLAVAWECTLVLRRRRKQRAVHKFLAATHITLFVLVTVRCVTVMTRALVGLRFHTSPDGSVDTGALSSWESLLANVAWLLAILISDGFLIYRVYVVWRGMKLVMIPPIIGWIAVVGSGVYLMYCLSTYGPGAVTFEGPLTKTNTAFCAFTLYTNLVSSCLIAYRIWSVRRDVQFLTANFTRDAVNSLVTILLESALFYTALLALHIIFLAMGSLLMYVCTDMEAPTIGLVFSSIIIRVSEGTAHGNTSSGGPTSGDASGSRGRTWTSGARTGANGVQTIDVAIKLETVTHHDDATGGDIEEASIARDSDKRKQDW